MKKFTQNFFVFELTCFVCILSLNGISLTRKITITIMCIVYPSWPTVLQEKRNFLS